MHTPTSHTLSHKDPQPLTKNGVILGASAAHVGAGVSGADELNRPRAAIPTRKPRDHGSASVLREALCALAPNESLGDVLARALRNARAPCGPVTSA